MPKPLGHTAAPYSVYRAEGTSSGERALASVTFVFEENEIFASIKIDYPICVHTRSRIERILSMYTLAHTYGVSAKAVGRQPPVQSAHPYCLWTSQSVAAFVLHSEQELHYQKLNEQHQDKNTSTEQPGRAFSAFTSFTACLRAALPWCTSGNPRLFFLKYRAFFLTIEKKNHLR